MSTATAVRERPILFSGPMVRAILDGTKTQTRRVMKLPVDFIGGTGDDLSDPSWWGFRDEDGQWWTLREQSGGGSRAIHCPYGQPGDRLWVREAYAVEPDGRVVYRADRGARHFDLLPPPSPTGDLYWLSSDYEPACWRPSIHMPRWASRITLELTDIRVERVQEITREDAIAEGVFECEEEKDAAARRALTEGRREVGPLDYFRELWNHINAARGYGWDANPWVWVLSFRLLPAPQGAGREG